MSPAQRGGALYGLAAIAGSQRRAMHFIITGPMVRGHNCMRNLCRAPPSKCERSAASKMRFRFQACAHIVGRQAAGSACEDRCFNFRMPRGRSEISQPKISCLVVLRCRRTPDAPIAKYLVPVTPERVTFAGAASMCKTIQSISMHCAEFTPTSWLRSWASRSCRTGARAASWRRRIAAPRSPSAASSPMTASTR